MSRDDGDGTCLHCGGTGYAIRSEFQDTEILRDAATGRTLLPWDIRALGIEEMRRRVAAGQITAEQVTIQRQVADPARFCRQCDAGRERERRVLADTPVLHSKRTRTRKNLEGERDAS